MHPTPVNGRRRLPVWLPAMVCAAAATAAQAQQDAALEPSPTAAQILPGAVEPATGDDAASASEAMPVDFFVDIWPILNAHCVKCHGPERRSSGLRLDGRKFAMRGGDSGRIVLGGTPATNELYARVSSSDRSYRMPKNAPPLSDREIAVLRRWVEQGAPWPVLEETPQSQSFFDRWVAYLGDQVDRYEPEYHYAQPYTIAFLLVQCAMLVVLRCRTAYRKGRPWSRGRLAAFCRFCDGVKPREVLLVVLVSLAALALAWSRGHTLEIESRLARAKTNQGQTHSPWTDTVFGWPPKPVRPDHPKQVAGTYYRGNCERNPELFNGGNYLTATFRVKLCDEEHKQLEVGRPLPAAGVFVYVEIERAPGTTDQLFSKELMESVVLVRNFYESPNNELKEEPVRLEALEPAMRWGAYVPIGLPDKAGRLDGVIYIYTGQVTNNTFGGSLHYAVQYALAFADGKLSPESDLWMDSFGNFAFESPRPPGKLPYREWFDYRPMPVITGENSKDPKLLGIEEYVEQGLIKGEKSKAPEPSPESEPPAQAEEPPDDK